MSSRAWTLDLLRGITQNEAIADHNKELIEDENLDGELKNKIRQLDKMTVALRREEQSYLLEQGENPNPLVWCLVKHSSDAYGHLVEVYEANPCEKAEELMKKQSAILAGYLSIFLGVEFQTCQRCLDDQLLIKEHDKKIHSAIIKSNDKGDE